VFVRAPEAELRLRRAAFELRELLAFAENAWPLMREDPDPAPDDAGRVPSPGVPRQEGAVSARQISRLAAVRLALAELGDVPNEELAAFVERRFGVKMPAAYVPIARASLRGLEQLEESRKMARELLASVPPEPKSRGGRPKGHATEAADPRGSGYKTS
jgi:hypothetical protein